MAIYRISRNIEASVVDWLVAGLASDGWTGIRVVKTFTQVYDGTLPVICVNVITPSPTKLEVGSPAWLKTFEVSIRIFATSDGQQLDLSDWLLDKLENSINYYEFIIVDGAVSEKNLKGKIQVNTIIRDEKEFTNIANLEQEDKFRHIISFSCRVATT